MSNKKMTLLAGQSGEGQGNRLNMEVEGIENHSREYFLVFLWRGGK